MSLPPIVLIDEDADDRELVSLLLRGAFGEVTILEVASASDLARVVSRESFGAVLTENDLSFIRGADVIRLVRDLRPVCPVVVLTRAPAEKAALELVHLAPDGLVPKTSAGLVALPQALRTALERASRRPEAAAAGAGDEMAYVVSHDLRKPVTQVVRYLELLDEEARGKLGDEGRDLFARARDGARRIEGMLDALLRCARVESVGAAFAAGALGPLVERVAARLVEAGEAPAGAVRLDGPLPRVWCDEAQVEQLFSNLLSNAFKFRRGGEPHAWIGSEDGAGEHWRLYCRDDGIGIDPAQSRRIFGMFQRLHTGAEYPGSGIGLALCRRIVARHDGRIWVDSEPGRGSTFRFTLAKRPRPGGERGVEDR